MTIADGLAPDAPLLFDQPQITALRPHGETGEGIPEPGPNLLYQFNHDVGDIEAALKACAHVYEDTFSFSRMTPYHMEPFVALARLEGNIIELWTCSQDPFLIRQDIANIFSVPDHLVRVHASYVGGGFGGKSFCKLEPLAVLLARKTGRPVRLCLSLDENFVTLSQHAAILILKTGVQADGTFVDRDTPIDSDFALGLRKAADRIGYGQARPRGRGIGLAVGFKDAGGEARAARAAVKITVTGRVVVQAGACELGQGIATALSQIAAEILNVPYDWVRYGEIDTDISPYDQGTHASSGIAVAGNAVARAAQDVRAQVLAFAAEKLRCNPDDLYLENWTAQKGGKTFPLQPLAVEYFGGYGCEFVGRGFFKVDEDLTTALNAKRLFWMPSWIGIEVEVDEETGQYVIMDFVAV